MSMDTTETANLSPVQLFISFSFLDLHGDYSGPDSQFDYTKAAEVSLDQNQ